MDEFESAIGKLFGGMLVGLAKSLIDGGVAPTHAVGLAGAAVVSGALGRDVLVGLGVPLRTVQQWQSTTRKALEGMDVTVPPAAAINQALEAMGFPFRVVEP